MKKNLVLLTLVALSLILTAGSCNESTEPDTESEYLLLQTNDYWKYDIYEVDENGVAEKDLLDTKIVALGDEETLDKRIAFPLIVSPNSDDELFTHISANNEGIYLYMGEIDLNKYVSDPNITTQIPIPIPGWIKIMDFNKNEWESFFLELNQKIEQDTVSGKLQITGKKKEQKEVTYLGKTYMADVVQISIDVFAKIYSPNGRIDEAVKSDITYTFIEGIGIYSVEQKANELIGITNNTIEILKENGNNPVNFAF